MLVYNLIRELQAVLRYEVVSSHALRSIIQLYRHVCQMIDCFCAVYGWILLLIFFEHFIIITDRSFFAIHMYRLVPDLTILHVLEMLSAWVLPLIVNDFLLTGACAAAETALHEFEKDLCNYEPKPRFRLLNALNLNPTLLYATFGIISSYLTVFLQFSPVE
ncbi:uncharacterized protein LOC126572518 [Anopheles aquasalis]|uniref:uncharacterized protein LOC126572518 n=1 Tax=Anopheles aquasalis TaxID=42839 RepID=UPI00215B756A|nr:uncharacterized protein LOC126572518 [Anopheles aquasalis]